MDSPVVIAEQDAITLENWALNRKPGKRITQKEVGAIIGLVSGFRVVRGHLRSLEFTESDVANCERRKLHRLASRIRNAINARLTAGSQEQEKK